MTNVIAKTAIATHNKTVIVIVKDPCKVVANQNKAVAKLRGLLKRGPFCF